MYRDPQQWIHDGLWTIRRQKLARGEVTGLRVDNIRRIFPNLLGPDKVACGASWPPGWSMIIYVLLGKIHQHNTGADPELGGSPIVIDQIKEKFGSLRFYWHGGYAKKRKENHYAWPSIEEISGAIDFAEYYTQFICDECGAIDGLRETRGWTTYVCKDHVPDDKIKSIPITWGLESTRPKE
jgi:hypothetical protein